MTVSLVLVRFPDRTVKFGRFQTTAEVVSPRLWSTPDGALESAESDDRGWDWPTDDPEPVAVCVLYGQGVVFDGLATRDRIVEPIEPFGGPGDPWGVLPPGDAPVERSSGQPDWVTVALDEYHDDGR